jgi:hypothetical protein
MKETKSGEENLKTKVKVEVQVKDRSQAILNRNFQILSQRDLEFVSNTLKDLKRPSCWTPIQHLTHWSNLVRS